MDHFSARLATDGTKVTRDNLGPPRGAGALQILLPIRLCSKLKTSGADFPCCLLLTEAHRVVCLSLQIPPQEDPDGLLRATQTSRAVRKGYRTKADEVGKSPGSKPSPCGTHLLVPLAECDFPKEQASLPRSPAGSYRVRPPLTSFKAVMILDLKMARAHSRATSQNVSMIPEDWTPFLLSS